MAKLRLDVLLVEKGLAESREKAKATIMSGVVFVNGQRQDKPGATIAEDAQIEVQGGGQLPYVSRGGLKLEKAFNTFHFTPENMLCIDCGASTGGFTDCMLQNGAKKVYAVDVGYGQLAWQIRQDPRVVTMERTNIRYVTHEEIPEELDFATIDVSFISLKLVLPVVKKLLKPTGRVICLIKPQFEAGREYVGKNGVVRDPATHEAVLYGFLETAKAAGFRVDGLTFSPIKGPKGNIEYLGFLSAEAGQDCPVDIPELVRQSHGQLGGTPE